MGAAVLDFFAMGVFFDDLEVDAFLFGIVTIIALTDFDLPGWNTGRKLVALQGMLVAALLRCGLRCVLVRLALRVLRCVARWWDFVARCWAARYGMPVLRARGLALRAGGSRC